MNSHKSDFDFTIGLIGMAGLVSTGIARHRRAVRLVPSYGIRNKYIQRVPFVQPRVPFVPSYAFQPFRFNARMYSSSSKSYTKVTNDNYVAKSMIHEHMQNAPETKIEPIMESTNVTPEISKSQQLTDENAQVAKALSEVESSWDLTTKLAVLNIFIVNWFL